MNELLAALITGGVPTLTVLIGIFYNNKRTDDLRSEIRQGAVATQRELDLIHKRLERIEIRLDHEGAAR